MKRLDMQNGILMPNIDSFYERTFLAVKSQPQEGNTFFLPAKGWGSEIAIRGQINGRKKHSKYLPAILYRSHSDFELYAVSKNFSYTKAFKDLFGAQETYEETRTKMFGRTTNNQNPIPIGYMKENSEVTTLNGLNIKTLNLEFLFADKLISEHYEFDKPNNHGRDISDSACIALLYDLDVDKIKKIIKDFYIQPQQEFIVSKINEENLRKRAQILLKKINEQKKFDADDRYINSILSYSQALSSKELEDLYADKSNWDNDKLKDEVALKIIRADLIKYKKNVTQEFNEVSEDNIFKKIDTFFALNAERRNTLDIEMEKISKCLSDKQIVNMNSKN